MTQASRISFAIEHTELDEDTERFFHNAGQIARVSGENAEQSHQKMKGE